jgi:branched-chain amino acid transport system substrate-binding protein
MDDPNPAIQKFVEGYKMRYNASPDALAGLGYDSAMVLFDAIKRAGTTEGPKLRDAIAQTKDFPGVTGKITLDSNRNANKPAVVLEIKEGKFVYRETISPES